MKFERKRDIIAERNRLMDKLEDKNKIIEELHLKLSGERHEVGTHCNGCMNLLRGKTWFMGAEVEEKICKLDVKRKDRKESHL